MDTTQDNEVMTETVGGSTTPGDSAEVIGTRRRSLPWARGGQPSPDGSGSAEPVRSRRPTFLRRTEARLDRVPLRAKLVGIMLILLVLALAITGLATQYMLHGYLVKQVDDQLRGQALAIVNRQAGGLPNSAGPSDYVSYRSYQADSTSEMILPYSRSTNDPLPKLSFMTAAQAGDRQDPRQQGDKRFEVYSVSSSRGDLEWRVVAIPVAGSSSGSLQIARPLDGVEAATGRLRAIVVLFGLMVTAICLLLGWYAIRRAFVPLVEVEETAAAIAAGDLSRRVPDHPKSTEVGRLTSSLNGMLSQIESAFRSREASERRTRRFAADASHELRTPLASIRGFAELYRQGAVREPDDVARTMGRIEDEAQRMGGLVEDLLLLARLDEQRPARAEPVDLTVLAGDATHDARGLAADRRVALTGLTPGHGPAPAVVIGDDSRLRQVVANLVANAVRHTPKGTPIEIAVGQANGLAVLEVRDHGRGLPAEEAEKVFERFYRLDSSRARGQGGGSGLGLSIVATVVAAHAGRVGVATTPGGGATFRVELPLAPATSPDGRDDVDLDDLDDDAAPMHPSRHSG